MQNENTPTEGQNSDQTESESALRGAACSPVFSDTPETDNLDDQMGDISENVDQDYRFMLRHARKLERQRNELAEALREMRYGHTDKAERMAVKALSFLENA